MRYIQGGVLLASAAALLFSAGCGSSGAKASASPSASGGASGFAAYAACLRQHGVNIPTARPSGRPSGGGGGFFGGGGANQQAQQACRSLAPRGGFGGGRGMQELQAFRSCLSDHGVKLTTPAPGVRRTPGTGRTPGAERTPGGRMFGGFDTSDPKVAKAVKTCRPLLPTRTPRPNPS
jgi:hypothetical protein